MAATAPGIKQLLEAEKFASDLIKQARNRKAKRLNQARTEAELEVKQFKLDLEKQIKEKEQADESGAGADLVAIEQNTKKQLESMNGSVTQNADEVVATLVKIVCDVKPELHINFGK